MLFAATFATIPPDDEDSPPVSRSPAGSDCSGSVMSCAALASAPGSPLLLTRCKWISFDAVAVTRQVADHDTSPPARLRLPLIKLVPTDLTTSPPPPRNEPSGPCSALPSAPR